jgi:hypothetical protein
MSPALAKSDISDKSYYEKVHKKTASCLIMKARIFNSHYMPRVNEEWAALVLGMQVNPDSGPDLVDENKNVEVKFTLISPRNYPRSWTVLEHQMDYNNGKPCFWALGTYELNRPVKKIRDRDIPRLEKLVVNRELYLVTWDWMHQYPASEVSGQTETSSWHNTFRYPKLKDLPKITHSFKVEKGLVHLTEGVPEKEFLIGVPF